MTSNKTPQNNLTVKGANLMQKVNDIITKVAGFLLVTMFGIIINNQNKTNEKIDKVLDQVNVNSNRISVIETKLGMMGNKAPSSPIKYPIAQITTDLLKPEEDYQENIIKYIPNKEE